MTEPLIQENKLRPIFSVCGLLTGIVCSVANFSSVYVMAMGGVKSAIIGELPMPMGWLTSYLLWPFLLAFTAGRLIWLRIMIVVAVMFGLFFSFKHPPQGSIGITDLQGMEDDLSNFLQITHVFDAIDWPILFIWLVSVFMLYATLFGWRFWGVIKKRTFT